MKQFMGIVTGNPSAKTVAIKVDSFHQHPIYKKRIRRSRTYLVNSNDIVPVGSQVTFANCKPISHSKRWQIIAVVGTK